MPGVEKRGRGSYDKNNINEDVSEGGRMSKWKKCRDEMPSEDCICIVLTEYGDIAIADYNRSSESFWSRDGFQIADGCIEEWKPVEEDEE